MSNLGYLIIALFFTFIFQYVISLLFAFKIRATAKGSYPVAALWGGIATLLSTFTVLLNALLPSLIGTGQSSKITYIIVSSIIITIGTVLGTLSISSFQRWYENRAKFDILLVKGHHTTTEAREIIRENDLAYKNAAKSKRMAIRSESQRVRLKYKEIKISEKAAK